MSNKFNFDELINRRDTDCAKWDLPEPDMLPMWVADMDFRSPAEVQEALLEAVRHGVFGYPHFGDCVQEAVADWVLARHGWRISPESVVLLPGVVTGFNLAANAFARPGDGLLVQPPTYGPFLRVAENFNLIQQENVLAQGEDGQYQVDLDAFEAAITPQTRIFMLCNPQNPTGRVFTREELAGMAEICLRHDVLICSDEIHSDLVYRGHQHLPLAMLDAEISAKTVTLLAPSKTFNIAGLKSSAAIIEDQDLREQFEAARQGMVGFVNALGAEAMRAAYLHGAPWLDALLVYLEANRDYLMEFVRERMPGVEAAAPQGTFLAWLDCRALELTQQEGALFNSFFAQKARVALNDGGWFGRGGKGFVRLNFGCPRSTLIEALERIERALAG
ncbi:MAG: pyridoxal phosphate-dependent aminotransferase [Anaerolineales bacterium]|nr:pyridoxal phosphate-dependent aminotransferase [Anaerolineales bacterium]